MELGRRWRRSRERRWEGEIARRGSGDSSEGVGGGGRVFDWQFELIRKLGCYGGTVEHCALDSPGTVFDNASEQHLSVIRVALCPFEPFVRLRKVCMGRLAGLL